MSAAMHINITKSGRVVRSNDSTISIALWLFIGVASALFLLFLAAYVMRMDAQDWSPIVMPWQLWISTAVLIVASGLLHLASRARRLTSARKFLAAAGVCGMLFLGVQLWGWQALLGMHVTPVGNPAGSFFYLLTAMHGLHVFGGLVGWGRTARSAWFRASVDVEMVNVHWRIALCARYWDFLLLVWIVLFAALGWLTPEVVRWVCGTR